MSKNYLSKWSKRLSLVLVSSLVLLSSCKQDEPKPTPKPPRSLPTKTVVSNKVATFSIPKGAKEEDYIISYEKNKVVLRLPNGFRASNGKELSYIKNFNSKKSIDVKTGDIISFPPCKTIPNGDWMKVSDVQYGQGSVALIGDAPKSVTEIIEEAAEDKSYSFVDLFNEGELSFKAPTPIKGFKIKGKLENSAKEGKLTIKLEAIWELLNKENVILKYKDIPTGKETIKSEFKLIGTCELSPVLRVKMFHHKDSRVPELFEVQLSGDIRLKLDAALAVQLEEELKTEELILGYLQLGAIPIGTSPVFVKPTLKLSVAMGVKGEAIAKMTLYDYTYHYSYLVGYDTTKGFYRNLGKNKGTSNKYLGVDNPYTRLSFEAKPELTQDFRLGLYLGIVGWDGAEVGVGGGLEVKEELKYTYDLREEANKRHQLNIDLKTSAYLFGNIKIQALYDLIDFEEELKQAIATWTIFTGEYYWGDKGESDNAPVIKGEKMFGKK